MTLQDTWAPIVQAALDEYLSKKMITEPVAIPAAPLKPLIVRHAEQLGLAFPPPGYERLKFVDFLDLFPSVVKARRRPGQDSLVVKAANAYVLDQVVSNDLGVSNNREHVAFRPDIFDAFTKVLPIGKFYWYSRDGDEFLAREPGTAKHSLVQIPVVTIEDAFSERRDFANTVPEHREALFAALDTQEYPLRAFSDAVKTRHLDRAWHLFRVDRLTKKINDWAEAAGVERNPAWEKNGARSIKPESNAITARETNAFLAGLMQLGPEDAKRVMVPLDIVLKLTRRD